jgi:hypothetical protein
LRNLHKTHSALRGEVVGKSSGGEHSKFAAGFFRRHVDNIKPFLPREINGANKNASRAPLRQQRYLRLNDHQNRNGNVVTNATSASSQLPTAATYQPSAFNVGAASAAAVTGGSRRRGRKFIGDDAVKARQVSSVHSKTCATFCTRTLSSPELHKRTHTKTHVHTHTLTRTRTRTQAHEAHIRTKAGRSRFFEDGNDAAVSERNKRRHEFSETRGRSLHAGTPGGGGGGAGGGGGGAGSGVAHQLSSDIGFGRSELPCR